MILPEILDANLTPVRRIQPIKASVRLNLTPLSTAELDLYPGETIPARSLISMYTVQGFAGVYRSSTPNETYGNRATRVHLEHAVAEIGDWIVGSEVEETIVTAASAISSLFASYGGTLWSLGTLNCSVNVRYSASKGTNVLEAILGIVSQVPGYMLTLDQSVTPWKIGIALQPETVTAEGRLSRNMTSVQITYDESELCNKVYISGIDTPFEAYDSQATYGVIEHYISESDLPTATAQMVALAYLQAHCDPAISVSISMLDLANLTGEPLDRITLGAKFRLALPEDGVSIEQHVIGIQFDDVYGNPEAITVTLANEVSDTVAYLKKQRRSGRASQRKVEKVAEDVVQQYQHWTTENEVYRESVYKIIGVTYDENGNVIYQTDPVTGEIIYDDAGNPIPVYDETSNGSITGKVVETAQNYSRIYQMTLNAPEFDPTATYPIGSMVMHEGTVYKFTAVHTGDWTGLDVVVVPSLQSQITQNAQEISQKVSQGDLAGYMTITAMRTAFGNSAVAADGTITKAEFSTSVVDGIATAGITGNKIDIGGVIQIINGGTGGQGDTTNSATISADKIELDATNNITLGSKIQISQGQMHVLMPMGIGTTDSAGGIVSINNGKVTAQNYDVRIGGALKFVTGQSSYYDLTSSVVAGMVKDASLDTTTNTLTLTKFDGTVINFSKAATPVTLTGLWSGSTYTATPSSGNSVSTTVSLKTVSDLTITSTDSQIQDHGKFVTASGTITIKATTGNLDEQGNPEYVDVLTSSFSGRDITDAYNEGWEAGNAAPSTTTVTGGWSGGTYTATAMPQNVQAETSLYGIVLNGDITKNTVIPKAINVPLRVVYDDGDPQTDAADKPSTGFTESISVDASLIYTDGQNSVSATFGAYSGTPSTATELSAGAYEFKITKDGTTTEQTFYTVPAAPSPVVPKVSKGTWQNGSITFTAGTAGDDTSTLKLYTSGAYSGTLDNVQNPTKVSFSILEDTGNGTTAATGATIFANVSTTTGTLKLSNFDETNNRITVSLDTKPSVNIGGSSAIQPGVTQKYIDVAKGTAQPNTPQWNESAHTYTITADGSFTVGGQSITQSQGSITGGFAPEAAINYGKNLAKGIASVTASQTNATAYGQAAYDEIPVESNGYYIITATPNMGNAVHKKFHAPASGGGGGGDRWARYLNPITLDAADIDEVTKTSFATYSDSTTETDDSKITSVQIDARAVYQAGVTAGMGGVVNVLQDGWNNGSNRFYPSAGNGSDIRVQLSVVPVMPGSISGATSNAQFVIHDDISNTDITGKCTFYLSRSSDGSAAYLKTNQYLPSNNNVIAKITQNGVPGEDPRLVQSLTSIKLTAADIATSMKTTKATFDSGDPQEGINISVDATDVYTKGVADGSKMTVEKPHIEPTALTRNNWTYTIFPSTGFNVMSAAQFRVEVPTYEGIASASIDAERDDLPAWWSKELGQGTLSKKYGQIKVVGNDSVSKFYVVDASNVYQAGVTAGAGYNVEALTTITDKITSNGTKTLYPSSGHDATEGIKFTVDVKPKLGTKTLEDNNRTYYASTYDYDGFSSVTVKVDTKIPVTAIECSEKAKSIGTNRGDREDAGSISKSGLVANSYLGFTISAKGTSRKFYIAVNP